MTNFFQGNPSWPFPQHPRPGYLVIINRFPVLHDFNANVIGRFSSLHSIVELNLFLLTSILLIFCCFVWQRLTRNSGSAGSWRTRRGRRRGSCSSSARWTSPLPRSSGSRTARRSSRAIPGNLTRSTRRVHSSWKNLKPNFRTIITWRIRFLNKMIVCAFILMLGLWLLSYIMIGLGFYIIIIK